MELRQLEHFLSVVDHGGLGRAAERIYLAQPTLSTSIRSLERELKVSLFHRTSRRLVPTSAGRELEPLARFVLDGVVAIEDAMRNSREVEGGVLTVACTPDMSSEAAAAWAAGFSQKYPAVQLDFSDVNSQQELLAAVAEGQVELGFSLETELRRDLRFVDLGIQRLLLVRPPEYQPPVDGAKVDLREIGDLPLVLRRTDGHEDEAIHNTLTSLGVEVSSGATVPNRSAQLTFVLRSGLQAFLPLRMCLAAFDAGACVLETDPLIQARFGIIHRSGTLAPAAQLFIAHVQHALGTWFDAIDRERAAGRSLVESVRAAGEMIS